MDRFDEAWSGVAARIARGELSLDAEVDAALEATGALEDPLALERVQASFAKFWGHVQQDPASALGWVTVSWAVVRRRAGALRLELELSRRRAMALFALGALRESERVVAGALGRLEEAGSGLEAAVHAEHRASLLGLGANARLGCGDVSQALIWLEEALDLTGRHGLRGAEGVYLSALGNARLAVGEVGAASRYYGDALEIAQEVGNVEGQTVNLNNLGLTCRAMGELEEAGSRFEEARSQARQHGDLRSAAIVEANLAQLAQDRGAWEEADRLAKGAMELTRHVGDRATEAAVLLRLAGQACERGSGKDALALLDRVEEALDGLGDGRRAGVWVERGRALALVGLRAEGVKWMVRGVEEAAGRGDRTSEAEGWWSLSWLRDGPEALDDLERAEACAVELEGPDLRAQVDAGWACAHARWGSLEEAGRWLERAEARAGRTERVWLRWVVRWAGLLVAKRRGEEVRARLEALAGELREAEFVVWAVEVERVVERECG